MRIEELKQREVINISDGKKLGFISDLEIDNGTVTAAIYNTVGQHFKARRRRGFG